jgi:hypothetical protein
VSSISFCASTDFHQVFVRYAASNVSGPIYLNTNITKISVHVVASRVRADHHRRFVDRSGDRPVVTYIGNGTSTPMAQNCSKLILAFPPVMHALEAANLDISADERTVFSPVGITKYWSGAVRVATPDGIALTGFLRETFIGLISQVLGKNFIPPLDFIPWLPEAAGEPVA